MIVSRRQTVQHPGQSCFYQDVGLLCNLVSLNGQLTRLVRHPHPGTFDRYSLTGEDDAHFSVP